MARDLWGGQATDDPLDDTPPEKAGPGPNGCRSGGLCDGSKWMLTKPAYAERLAKEKAEERGITDPDLIEELARRMRRYSFAYPCRACNTAMFLRWLGGHLDAEHDQRDCDDEGCQKQASRRKH